MTRILKTAAIAVLLSTSAANAGSLQDPIIENDLIIADATATSSAAGAGLLLLLATIMVVVATD